MSRKLGSDGAAVVQLALGGEVGRLGLLLGAKRSEHLGGPGAGPDLRQPTRSTRLPRDAEDATAAVALRALAVLAVDGRRDIPQVRNPVVRAVTVDVVDHALGPAAVHVVPRKSMRKVNGSYAMALEVDCDVAGRVPRAGYAVRPLPLPPFTPHEHTGVRVVIQLGQQALMRQVCKIVAHRIPQQFM